MRIILSFCTIIFISCHMLGCSCDHQAFSVKQIINSDHLIIGTVLSVDKNIKVRLEKSRNYNTHKFYSRQDRYSILINQIIRGKINRDIINVYTSSSGCTAFFRTGEEYYIFLHEYSGTYTATSCRPHQQIDQVTTGFKAVIDEYLNCKGEIWNWHNERGALVANGTIYETQPVGFWKFFRYYGQIREDGYFLDGLKSGTWHVYKRRPRIMQHEICYDLLVECFYFEGIRIN